MLTGYLQEADRSQLATGLGHHRLLLSATDCVWCTVVGDAVVEDIFLEEGGIFCLLDLLQVMDPPYIQVLQAIHMPLMYICNSMCVSYRLWC